MPDSSLRTTALADNWGDHAWASERAYALALREKRPSEFGERGQATYCRQARRIARQIERERAKRLRDDPSKCGVWPFVMSILISLIGSMLSRLFTWVWDRWTKTSAAVSDEWDRELQETEQL